MAGERTEQASPRKRQKAREQGDRPRSRDLLAASSMLAGSVALGVAAPGWLAGWSAAYRRLLLLNETPAWRNQDGVAAALELRAIAVSVMLPLCAVLAACAGAALVSGVAQGGGLTFYAPVLQPKWSRIAPLAALKNLFSLRAGSRLGKSLVPVAALSALAWQKMMRQAEVPVFSVARLPGAMTDAYDLLLDAAWILLIWSLLDFAIEWRSWSERLKMSKQELRDEFKETEGNPQIRGRLRNIQRQMRARMLRADVAKASVVITNPTHYAIALSFDFATMEAPRVLAKGRNLVAEQIKAEARWAGVPLIENPPLARSLYRTVEAGQAIPFELYAAVAGILAYLYRQQVEERIRKQAAPAPGAEGVKARNAATPTAGRRPERAPAAREAGAGPAAGDGRQAAPPSAVGAALPNTASQPDSVDPAFTEPARDHPDREETL